MSDKNKKRPGRFQVWEDKTIESDWMTYTDEEIGQKLGRTTKSIERRRKMLGYAKPNGRPLAATRIEAIKSSPTEYNLAKLSKEDRISFYKTKFKQNPRYEWLVKILLEEEMSYYKHKYIEIIDNLDSINMQEEDLLHNMIMKEISIIRLQTRIKDEEQKYREWLISVENKDEDAHPTPRDTGLYKELSEAEKQYITYQEKLKLTREQRLKTDKEDKVTISSIVQSLLDFRMKDKMGRDAGNMAYVADACKDDMGKMNFLLGG